MRLLTIFVFATALSACGTNTTPDDGCGANCPPTGCHIDWNGSIEGVSKAVDLDATCAFFVQDPTAGPNAFVVHDGPWSPSGWNVEAVSAWTNYATGGDVLGIFPFDPYPLGPGHPHPLDPSVLGARDVGVLEFNNSTAEYTINSLDSSPSTFDMTLTLPLLNSSTGYPPAGRPSDPTLAEYLPVTGMSSAHIWGHYETLSP